MAPPSMGDVAVYSWEEVDWQGSGPVQSSTLDLYLGDELRVSKGKRPLMGPKRLWLEWDRRPGVGERRGTELLGVPHDYSPHLRYRLMCPVCKARPGQVCRCDSRPWPID